LVAIFQKLYEYIIAGLLLCGIGTASDEIFHAIAGELYREVKAKAKRRAMFSCHLEYNNSTIVLNSPQKNFEKALCFRTSHKAQTACKKHCSVALANSIKCRFSPMFKGVCALSARPEKHVAFHCSVALPQNLPSVLFIRSLSVVDLRACHVRVQPRFPIQRTTHSSTVK
jgi:hypothetical protein